MGFTIHIHIHNRIDIRSYTLSPPNDRIIHWINDMHFETREAVENYVLYHGGASLAMSASIDFVFGSKEPTSVPVPEATGKTPLEQIQAGEIPLEPSGIPEMERPVEIPQQVPVMTEERKSLIRRFLDWLGQ